MDRRLAALRRHAGHGAALAMTPYLLIKVRWVVGALLGLAPHDSDLTLTEWVVLNTVTIAMAATGIALALALARPWGARLPAPPLLALAWIGSGLLVPMIPYMLVSTVVDALSPATAGPPGEAAGGAGAVMPAWEGALIEVSFAGMGLGLAVALPLYLRQRWPHMFRGRLAPGVPDPSPAGAPGGAANGPRTSRPRRLVVLAVSAAVVVALLNIAWVAGDALGLTQPEAHNLDGRLLAGNTALWALTGAWGAWSLAGNRPPRCPVWLPVTLVWVTSGLLVAWNCWRLPVVALLAADPGSRPWLEQPGALAAQAGLSIVAGGAMVATLLRFHRYRRRP